MSHRDVASVFALIGVPLYVFVSLLYAWTHVPATRVPEERDVVLTFVGDMMFDRYIRTQAVIHGYDTVLEDVLPLFASSTFVVGNLEGPITTFKPVSTPNQENSDHFRFTFDPTVATLLAQTGFSAVLIGNNHIYNFGNDGLVQTLRFLDQARIGYVGNPLNPYTPWRAEANGVHIAIYAYNPWYSKDVKQIVASVKKEPDDVFVVIMAHWGEEYTQHPTQRQRTLAKTFSDAGADIVVGSHPHVVQPKETYNDTLIYYSLGNFIFDQYFSDAVRCGAVLSVSVRNAHIANVQEHFVRMKKNGTTKRAQCMNAVPIL